MTSSESARERDVYKYYQPWLDVTTLEDVPIDAAANGAQATHTPRASHDKTLTALAQLAALRLNVKRGMVSLINSETQIILAEATQTLSLIDDSRHAPDDHIWLGNVSIPRGDAVCGTTFGSTYTVTDEAGLEHVAEALVIPNMRDDSRFRDKPYVVAEKGVQFYAGVPIITQLGNRIGVYAVSHTEPRPGLTADELQFMQDAATTVTEHLEMIKSRNDKDRGERMVKGLASFIEGLSTLKHQSNSKDNENNYTIQQTSSASGSEQAERSTHSRDSRNGDLSPRRMPHQMERIRSINDKFPAYETMGQNNSNGTSTSTESGDASTDETLSSASNIKEIFQRAAFVIRKATKADGCVFFDASHGEFTGDIATTAKPTNADHSQTSGSDTDRPEVSARVRRRARALTGISNSDASEIAPVAAQILGLSLRSDQLSALRHFTLYESDLKKCLLRYPHGRIFNLNQEGSTSSGDESLSDNGLSGREDASRGVRSKKSKKRRSKYLPTDFIQLLPGVRAVVFLPLFDFAQNRWYAGGFLWTNLPGRLANPEDEMPYLKAFGSCIMSEVAGMEALRTNRAKTTFIASISHELRSPLHGILGSIEFLEDTLSTAYQMSLIGSIETCGKTLLDTMDHLLDYAKINNLTKAAKQSSSIVSAGRRMHKRPGSDLSGITTSLTADLDLACLVEDVLDAVFAGQTFKKTPIRGQAGSDSVGNVAHQIRSLALDDTLTMEQTIMTGSDKFSGRVVIVVNVAKAASWWVRSEPGGLRRVIMNLFGNAIKYCEVGAIEVQLNLIRAEKSRLAVEFVIRDTGRGMSKDFMVNQMFRAFAQEDSFSYGTGLGLSIVKQIVDSLGGKIDVKSQKNVGTEVRVALTLPTADKPPTNSDEDLMATALKITRGSRMCLLNPKDVTNKSNDVQTSRLTACVSKMCKDWFEVDFSEAASVETEADVFLYAEPPPIEFLLDHHSERRQNGRNGKDAALLIICTNAYEAASLRAGGISHLVSLGRVIEVVSQPVGPRKLAKILIQCLRRVDELTPIPTLTFETSDLAAENLSSAATTAERRASHATWIQSQTVYDDHVQKHRPSIDTFKWKSDIPSSNGNTVNVDDALSTNVESRLEWSKVKTGDLPTSLMAPDSSESDGQLARRQSDVNDFGLIGNHTGAQNLPHVLVVDDNPINLKLLVTFMKKIKFPYETAVNGLEAFEKFKARFGEKKAGVSSNDSSCSELITTSCSSKTFHDRSALRCFDYVLMDLQMPIMDGLTSTRKIREFETGAIKSGAKAQPSTIIAITGVATGSVQEDAYAAGMSHFLTKPVRFKALQSLIEINTMDKPPSTERKGDSAE